LWSSKVVTTGCKSLWGKLHTPVFQRSKTAVTELLEVQLQPFFQMMPIWLDSQWSTMPWKALKTAQAIHLVLVNLMGSGLSGKVAEKLLEQVGLVCNKNSIPQDP
jgi:hypothetical protein